MNPASSFMKMPQNFDEAKKSYELATFTFIETELGLAMTFCEIALSAETAEKADRNLDHARQAFHSAIRFLQDAPLPAEMSKTLHEKTLRLGLMLQGLLERSRHD
jgi:hypothetical protein